MNRIDRDKLIRYLGFTNGKIPADKSGTFLAVRCLDARDNVLVIATVRLDKSAVHPDGRKSSTHRTYLACPVCKRWIPTGRYHQHANTAICRKGTQ